ncbi:MarR family winged helix-turn-helix transcriptional regulator [Nocardia sp. NPDC051570]|uniref:MarR family winged helix-turn-helix transcriptional regulator n=1 Tax=Nocardia sp. NPDC051570 TaxID=3364324 RepID=UPI00378DC5FC
MDSDTTHTELSAREKELWRGFLRFSGKVISAVERDLFAATGLSGADFQILARLYESEEQRLGQKQLGELVGWTTTRLSHQLTRMRTRGFVDRAAAGHGRLMTISLADAGRRTYESALAVHANSVRAHFFRHLDATSMSDELWFMDDGGCELDSETRS